MSAQSPDSRLLAACARFHALTKRIEEHDTSLAAEPAFNKLADKQDAVIRKLGTLTPQTEEGRKARAKIAFGLVVETWEGGGVEDLAVRVLREMAGEEHPHGA